MNFHKIDAIKTIFYSLKHDTSEGENNSDKKEDKLSHINKTITEKIIYLINVTLIDLKNLIFYPYNQTQFTKLIHKDYDHLGNVMNWLFTAAKMKDFNGVSAAYSYFGGWESSYVETTGYIIETFLEYGKLIADNKFINASRKFADWLISTQLEGGAFRGGFNRKPTPIVFNTGQVIFGLIESFKEFQDEKYLDSAKKAGDWLIEVQSENGAWEKFTFQNISHSYNSRVAWALLKLFEITSDEKYKTAAIKNIEWVLENSNKYYWLKFNSFNRGEPPLTHTICYSIRGILESGLILNEKKYIDFAVNASDKLCDTFLKDGLLFATYNNNWKNKDDYICLTGCAQLSIILLKILKIKNKKKYLYCADNLLSYLKWIQQNWDKVSKINFLKLKYFKGGIPGSFPIWGKYDSFFQNNWSQKFYAEALLLRNKLKIEDDL